MFDDLVLLQILMGHLVVFFCSVRLMEKLGYDVIYDSFIEFANCTYFIFWIEDVVISQRDDVAFFMIDLSGFQEINNVLGYEVGDQFLIVLVERLRVCILPTVTIVWIGGDEFVILLVDLGFDVLVAAIDCANQIRARLCQSVCIGEVLLVFEVIVGVVLGRLVCAEDLWCCVDIV